MSICHGAVAILTENTDSSATSKVSCSIYDVCNIVTGACDILLKLTASLRLH